MLRAESPFNFCVIDEVDSILIDEARTPLIISGPSDKPSTKYYKVCGQKVWTDGVGEKCGQHMCMESVELNACIQRKNMGMWGQGQKLLLNGSTPGLANVVTALFRRLLDPQVMLPRIPSPPPPSPPTSPSRCLPSPHLPPNNILLPLPEDPHPHLGHYQAAKIADALSRDLPLPFPAPHPSHQQRLPLPLPAPSPSGCQDCRRTVPRPALHG